VSRRSRRAPDGGGDPSAGERQEHRVHQHSEGFDGRRAGDRDGHVPQRASVDSFSDADHMVMIGRCPSRLKGWRHRPRVNRGRVRPGDPSNRGTHEAWGRVGPGERVGGRDAARAAHRCSLAMAHRATGGAAQRVHPVRPAERHVPTAPARLAAIVRVDAVRDGRELSRAASGTSAQGPVLALGRGRSTVHGR
jgi:hypothetical protein